MSAKLVSYQYISKNFGLNRTRVWKMVRQGLFPAPRKIGAGSVLWRSHEIDEWFENLPSVEYAGGDQ